MSLTNAEVLWLSRANSVDLRLFADGSAVDLASVTQIKLNLGSVVIDSTDAATGQIRWNQAGYETGEVRVFASTGLSTGRYNASLVVFDPSNTAGVVWDDDIPLRIKSDPLAT